MSELSANQIIRKKIAGYPSSGKHGVGFNSYFRNGCRNGAVRCQSFEAMATPYQIGSEFSEARRYRAIFRILHRWHSSGADGFNSLPSRNQWCFPLISL
jgi:hypothetical protein